MDQIEILKRILSAQLGPTYPPAYFQPGTALLGSIPELDSMSVVAILAAIEEQFGIAIPDDDINADVFATVGSLQDFVWSRLQSD